MSFNAAALRLMQDKGLSISDVIEIAEAMESRSKAAERQARYRKRKARDVTNDDVTRDVTPSLKEETSKPLSSKPDGFSEGRTTRAQRLPDDWRPAKLDRGTVSGQIVENRGQEWARRALESFKNHWRSANGPNARKRDWQAAFANWVIEQDNRDGRSRPSANGMGGPRPDPTLAIVRAAVAAQREDRGDHWQAGAPLPAG